MEYDVNDFIGVFDGVFEKEYCDDLINKFEFLYNSYTDSYLIPQVIKILNEINSPLIRSNLLFANFDLFLNQFWAVSQLSTLFESKREIKLKEIICVKH